jgi:hypothetical protein
MPRSENKATPLVVGDTLYHPDGGLTVGSVEWFAWLNQAEHRLFYVESPAGSFTARKEPRRSGHFDRHYWYAYRHQGRKMYKAYLGQSEQLTATRLYNVAHQLAQKVQQ